MTTTVRYARFEAYSRLAAEVPRPYIPVRIYSGGRRVDCLGLVDSGADATLFNDGYAVALGINLTNVTAEPIGGIGGNTSVQFVELEMSVAGQRFKDRIGFTSGIAPSFGLLGRTGFFLAHAVGFDQRQQRLLFHRLP